MVTCNLEIDLPDAVNAVSSANIFANEYCKLFGKSFNIYTGCPKKSGVLVWKFNF